MRARCDRRRRCRRHLHRSLLVRRGERDASPPPRRPPIAATKRSVSSRGCGARTIADIGSDRARHHGRHQRAAGAQGRARRPDHDARLSRRAGDAPPRPAAYLGALGRFHADQRPRHAARGRRARSRGRDACARRSTPRRSGRRRTLARQGRRGARDRLHQRLRQSRQRARRRRRRARVWPNENIAISSEILPEIREFERTSTTAINAYLQPVVGSYLEKLGEALAARRLSPGSFTSCSRTAA